MKHSRSFEDKYFEFMTKTIIGYTLQTPVPIIIVIFAERISAINNLFPDCTIICHTHIMFATNPLRYFSLKYFKQLVNSVIVKIYSVYERLPNIMHTNVIICFKQKLIFIIYMIWIINIISTCFKNKNNSIENDIHKYWLKYFSNIMQYPH